jgi:hypothetical protein
VKPESILGICGLAVAILALVAAIFQPEVQDFSCNSLGLFCAADVTISVRGYDVWVGFDGQLPPAKLHLGDEPLKCDDSLVSEQLASARQILQGPLFSATPDADLPNQPSGIGDELMGPFEPTRSLFWDLSLNFHQETNTILTVEATVQHPETEAGDHDNLPGFRIDTGGNSKCEITAPLFLEFTKISKSDGPGDYSLNVHITGLGIEPVSAIYNFTIIP